MRSNCDLIHNWVLSYPRSGNTLVRLLIANLRYPDIDCGYDEINYMVPDAHQKMDWEKVKKYGRDLIIAKSHDAALSVHNSCRRVLYIYRDPRDVVISCYHYRYWARMFAIKNFDVETMEFNDYFNMFMEGGVPCGLWSHHVAFWCFKAQRFIDNLLVLKYEDLIHNTDVLVRSIARFFDIEYDDDLIHGVVNKTKYERCVARAPAEGVHPKKLGLTGSEGGWKEVLTLNQQHKMRDKFGSLMTELGYEID